MNPVTPGFYLDGMEQTQTTDQAAAVAAPFEDPVAYLASFGIEAELVAVTGPPMTSAA